MKSVEREVNVSEVGKLDGFLDVAKWAARQAGEFLLNNLDGTREIDYKGEGHSNPQSRVDRRTEDIILGIIGGAFPEHSFVSEERGRRDTPSDYKWIIDPLDGTINFVHGHRYFAVSISLLYQRDVVLGVIYNPLVDEMFTAMKGRGACLNGGTIRVSEIASVDKGLVGMGFPYDRNSEAFHRSTRNFVWLARNAQAVRRDGSTALALCNVSCGRYDGFCVVGNEPWDYAAGILLVVEAGGKVTDSRGESFDVMNNDSELLATNGRIHQSILLKCFRDEEAA